MENGWDAGAWAAFLTRELGAPVEVAFGRARHQVLVARPRGSGYCVRMHQGFAAAPAEVRAATAHWLRSGRRARRATDMLDAWIDGVLVPSFAHAPPRAVALDPKGRAHDLERIADDVLSAHLGPDLLPPERRPSLTWSRRAQTGARRSLHLGTYDAIQNLVRVHRVLDQDAVPAFFVRFILFHELLHAALPPRREGRHVVHHGREFRRREALYPDFERAKRWEDANLPRLLRSARTGRPMRGGAAGAIQRLLFD